MTGNFSGSPDPSGTAKIYTFPARGRFAAEGEHAAVMPTSATQLPAGVTIASGSGWYHDEAILAEQRRTN